jgi:hypothetical protein
MWSSASRISKTIGLLWCWNGRLNFCRSSVVLSRCGFAGCLGLWVAVGRSCPEVSENQSAENLDLGNLARLLPHPPPCPSSTRRTSQYDAPAVVEEVNSGLRTFVVRFCSRSSLLKVHVVGPSFRFPRPTTRVPPSNSLLMVLLPPGTHSLWISTTDHPPMPAPTW